MDEPRIRYARTADDVNIAFWMVGEAGPVILHAPPGPVGNIAGEMRVGSMRAWYERLTQSFRVVRYDPRGTGSSGQSNDATHRANVLDLRAVVEAQDAQPLVIFTGLQWSLSAIEVAARWPEAVSHLILWDPLARPADHQPNARLVATRALITEDWKAYTDAWAQAGFGWARAESAREWSRWMREATTPEHTLARIEAYAKADVTPLLKDVKCPVLVVGHGFGPVSADPEAAKRIAAQIPDAQLMKLDGPQAQPTMLPERVNEHAEIVERFLGAQTVSTGLDKVDGAHGTAVILFTDIVSSTELTERMGDAAFRDASRALDAGLRAAIRDAGGSAIEGKLLGDGVLATFPSAAQAIDGARQCLALSAASELGLHIGLHAGDVIREEVDGRRDVFGGAVNIASRICGLSAGGEILVSDVVRGMARSSAGVVFEDRGEQEMKGVGEPVRVYAVVSG